MHHSPVMTIVLPMGVHVQRFEDTLASLLRYQPARTQLVVVHDGSYQNPHGLDEVEFVVTTNDSTLGDQLASALRVSDAPLIGIVRPGVLLDENWQAGILSSFDDPQVASVSPAIVDENRPNRLVTAGIESSKAYMRKLVGCQVRLGRKAAKLNPLGPTSWAGFYRRSVLDLLGTPDAQLDSLYLDADLALGIQQLGFENVFQQECVLTVEDSTLISKEAMQPHGCAASRARTRFGNQGSSLSESLQELIVSPFKPWYLKHVVGKFSARAMKDIDEAYRRRLLQKIQELESGEFEEADILRLPTRFDSLRRVA